MPVHVSETEAVRDIAGLLERVRGGEEIVIDGPFCPVAVLAPAEGVRPKRASESLALAKQHAAERGYEPVMDDNFAADMREIVLNRDKRPRRAAWE